MTSRVQGFRDSFQTAGPPKVLFFFLLNQLLFKKINFIYLFRLCWVFVAVHAGFSLVAVLGLLIAVVSLVVAPGSRAQAQ